MTCTFFGHRDTPTEIYEKLKETIVYLINEKNVTMFYVGNNGAFDRMAKKILQKMKNTYNINYYVVLAYIPKKDNSTDYSDTIYYDKLHTVPYKFRIVKRNKLMIEKSDYVITYAKHIGNARELQTHAERQGKIVINLA